MANEPEPEVTAHSVHFSVDASVIFQLGEHLISDAVQALVELIKNSFDADATQVLVEVDSKWSGKGPSGLDRVGRIIITDNGFGMTKADLERGWLTLSNSSKTEFKKLGRTTPRGRTPLGEKGLGRLGAQRLGHDIEIVTVPEGAGVEFSLRYSWDSFSGAASIEAVKLILEERQTAENSGTWITICGLKSPETWTDADARSRLEEGLSQLVSPYSNVSDFLVDVVVDGGALELARITAEVLTAADLHYDLRFEGESLTVGGRAKLAFFQPPSGDDLRRFNRVVAADRGESFFTFLADRLRSPKKPAQAGLDLRRSSENEWFVDFSATIALADQKPVFFAPITAKPQDRIIANPGSFSGAVDSFDLGDAALQEQAVFDSRKAFRNYVKRFSGIRVYRDGFGIRVDRDWLGLSETSTSGKSYYGLRPSNTLGYVAISARNNPGLLEKTDREGFQVSPHYENFYKLLRAFVKFSEYAQTQLRRSYNAFLKSRLVADSGPDADVSPGALAGRIRASLDAAGAHRQTIHQESDSLRKVIASTEQQLNAVLAKATKRPNADLDGALNDLRSTVAELRAESARIARPLQELDDYLGSLGNLDPIGQLLNDQIAELESRIGDLYEAAALGLTAEALSHELAQIADSLQARATRIQRFLKARVSKPPEFIEFVIAVQTSVQALRYQLGHLAPTLRFARDTKEPVRMGRFLAELLDYHEERLRKNGIVPEVETKKGGDFTVLMSRGKLTQVFDNLILNSEYWITRIARRGQGRIIAKIDQPFVYLFDTGPGVDPLYEATLFQPFVTGKPKGEGRGLGLFIIEQLLAMDGCTIALAEQRNERGRRHVFELNFVEAIHE